MLLHKVLRSFLICVIITITPNISVKIKRQIYDPNLYNQDFGPSGPTQDFGPSGPIQDFGPSGPPGSSGPPQNFGPRPQRPQRPQNFRPEIFDQQDFNRPPPGFNNRPPQGYRPFVNNPHTFGGFDPLGGLTKAMESVARYDDKKCVARMLCELSAGGTPGGYRADSFFDFSALRSIADLLGAMTESPAASPMLMFGRAALLGATMRDPYRCYSSYPQCPRDPDRLVDYLNNHNGGFFKLFSPQNNNDNYQNAYTTRRPPYYRRGKKLRKQKYPAQSNNDGYDNEDQQQFQNKDVPISGERPILADPNYDNNNQYYVTPKPSYNDQYYTTPRDQYIKPQKRPFRNTKINFQSNDNPNYYYTTPNPIRFDNSDYNNDDLNYHDNQQYYTTRRPNRGFAFTNDYDKQNNNNNYEVTTSRPIIYATPYTPHAENQLPDVYTRPNRVLYASSSRPYKTSRTIKPLKFPTDFNNIQTNNFNSPLKYTFNIPTTNNKYLTRDTNSPHGVLFPDRTGTGELRLDTAELEQSGRGGKSLRFPRQETSPTTLNQQDEKVKNDKQVVFPTP